MKNTDIAMMRQRRLLLRAAGTAALLAVLPPTLAQRAETAIAYKSPTCGCCTEWVKHMRANGFKVEVHDLNDVSPVRRRYGVPGSLASCHTALVGGYVIEGHVPAADIKRLLRERPNATGLSVPGMVVGSPGMEQGTPQPYDTVVFDANGHRVFARH